MRDHRLGTDVVGCRGPEAVGSSLGSGVGWTCRKLFFFIFRTAGTARKCYSIPRFSYMLAHER